MALLNTNGMKWCISASYASIPPLRASAFEFLFDWQIIRESERLKPLGIDSYSAIGIHPRSIPKSPEEADKAIEIVKEYITSKDRDKNQNIKAIGEIGIDSDSSMEKEIYYKQLALAKDANLPVIIHTPKKNKKEITKSIIEILDTFKPIIAVIDHIDAQNFLVAHDSDYHLGFTMQTGKLTSQVAIELLKSYDIEDRVLLNSDVCDVNNEMGGIINLITALHDKGFNDHVIQKVICENAKKLFNITDSHNINQ